MDEIKIIKEQAEEIKRLIWSTAEVKTATELTNKIILMAFCTEAILIKCKEYEDKENAERRK